MTMRARTAAVIGGGIVGLAVARELTRRFPGIEVTVFDKEARVAAHQSGHNSGVVHAGIYYTPGSLKAKLCLRGGTLLREFCAEHGIRLRELGKLVVASSHAELDGLAEIERRALANGVPGIRRVSKAEIGQIEPHVRGAAALHSPHTASVDFVGMCQALATQITSAGGTIRLGTRVRSVSEGASGVTIRSDGGEWTFDQLIVCAGLTGDSLAAQVGGLADMRIVPFRGEYYELRPAARDRVRGMVYPVPDPRYPFLGVHLTRDVNDGVHVGPNAVLALAFEGYRWRDIDVADLRDVARWPGTARLIRQHWRYGLKEMTDSLVKRRYVANVRRYLPDMRSGDMVRSTAGVRAQAVRRDGSLVDDFVLQSTDRVLLVRNAPSPAATSSLAIAEHIVSALDTEPAARRLGL
ncbi:MAG TPA: L-2-hydroxyglutarate oxidase [Trebonia sp.]|nr:L-2-hydroxyglutarate oxidase [Trebonia sp.]